MSRVRRKPGAREALLALAPPLVIEPEAQKGIWQGYFSNTNPIHIELGMGKGTFITNLARNNPNINYIGLEVKEEVLLTAIEKPDTEALQNIAFIWANAQELDNLFNSGEVERIYINFCDPWPKVRHAKRRLTHNDFLNIYQQVLINKGQIHFKTDDTGLFEFSLNEFCKKGWLLQNISLDLYANEPLDNIATEYELKFVKQGLKIYRLEATISDN